VDKDGDGFVHIPVLFGDDYTHVEADLTYRASKGIEKCLTYNSKNFYGRQIIAQHSLIDDYLSELQKEGYEY